MLRHWKVPAYFLLSVLCFSGAFSINSSLLKTADVSSQIGLIGMMLFFLGTGILNFCFMLEQIGDFR